jgi:serine/threonine protein kinase
MVLNGSYRIVDVLGEGGTSTVYEAVNVTSGSRVAVKVIRPQLAAIAEMRELLVMEARVLENLNHPAIVAYRGVHDDTALGVTYVVTVLVEGPSLAQVLPSLAPSPEAFRRFALDIASGLAAAHDKNIIHRDISPDNIMLPNGNRPEGRLEDAKLIDFGISKNLIGVESTIIGDGFAGKLGYAAPEQFGEGETGTWTDVYSFGLVLLALAGGKAPDMGRSRSEAIARRKQVPDLSAVPDAMRQTIGDMLQPDVGRRLRTMHAVIAQITGAAAPSVLSPDAETRRPPPQARDERRAEASSAPRQTREAPSKSAVGGVSGPMAGVLADIKRNAVAYGIAGTLGVILLVFVAALVLVRPSAPVTPPSPDPTQIQTASAPEPASQQQPPQPDEVERTAAVALDQVPCSWLDIKREGGADGTLAIVGIGDSAAANRAASEALRRIGAQVAVDTHEVWNIESAGSNVCAVLNTLRRHRFAWSASGRSLSMGRLHWYYQQDPSPCGSADGRRWAKPKAHVDIRASQPGFVVAAVNTLGQIERIQNDEKLRQYAQDSRYSQLIGYKDGQYDLTLCTDNRTPDPLSHGIQGLLLIDGEGTDAANLPATNFLQSVDDAWLRAFDAAAQGHWKVEMVWYTVSEEGASDAP